MRAFLNSSVDTHSHLCALSNLRLFALTAFLLSSLLIQETVRAAERLPSTAEGNDIELLTPPATRDRDQPPPSTPGTTTPGPAQPQSQGTSSTTVSNGTPEQIGEKPDRPTAQEVFLRDQQVLLKRGQLTAELGMFYSKTEQDELALLPLPPAGTTVVPALARVEQDTFLSIYTLRYGLLNDLQLIASAPLFHQTNTVTIRNLAVVNGRRSRTDTEWGNISVGLRYGLLAQGPGYPEVIPSIVGQIPTGRNSASVGGGLAFVKTLDPAVLFANVNYRRVLRDGRFINLTRMLPEAKDVFDATIGYGFALNDTLTLNTSVTGFFTRRTEFETVIPPSTEPIEGVLSSQEQISLQLGFTSLLAENLYVEPTVSFGLTGTESSAVVGLTIPYTFDF